MADCLTRPDPSLSEQYVCLGGITPHPPITNTSLTSASDLTHLSAPLPSSLTSLFHFVVLHYLLLCPFQLNFIICLHLSQSNNRWGVQRDTRPLSFFFSLLYLLLFPFMFLGPLFSSVFPSLNPAWVIIQMEFISPVPMVTALLQRRETEP